MDDYHVVIGRFVQETIRIIGENLVGIYLHGSAVMGCFHPSKSDLDFIIVIKNEMTKGVKRDFMDMVVALNAEGPAKGIEMSVVKREVCDPFIYPTPFELHFSIGHLKWYQDDPEGYLQKMNGTDRDLAAHFTVIRARGKCLYGTPIEEVFGDVPQWDYIDSLWYDIEDAEEGIVEDTMYLTLNLPRVLAYLKEKKVLSKQEGGEWGLGECEYGSSLPEKYHSLLREALKEYRGEEPTYNRDLAVEYARFMISAIKSEIS